MCVCVCGQLLDASQRVCGPNHIVSAPWSLVSVELSVVFGDEWVAKLVYARTVFNALWINRPAALIVGRV